MRILKPGPESWSDTTTVVPSLLSNYKLWFRFEWLRPHSRDTKPILTWLLFAERATSYELPASRLHVQLFTNFQVPINFWPKLVTWPRFSAVWRNNRRRGVCWPFASTIFAFLFFNSEWKQVSGSWNAFNFQKNWKKQFSEAGNKFLGQTSRLLEQEPFLGDCIQKSSVFRIGLVVSWVSPERGGMGQFCCFWKTWGFFDE